ncbi:MAG: FixH family protein [Hyphomicrobiales bacterium]|nr:FixH family protein [Hyphomicrobiales bacterium]
MSHTTDRPDGGPGRLNGPKVLAILVGFFLVIFAANGALIFLALDSWPGLETKSSFKAGQVYQQELDAAKDQADRAWQVSAHIERLSDGAATVRIELKDKEGAPLSGLGVTARLDRPTTTSLDQQVSLAEREAGIYGAEMAGVDAGAWTLTIEAVDAGGKRLYRSRNRVSLQ